MHYELWTLVLALVPRSLGAPRVPTIFYLTSNNHEEVCCCFTHRFPLSKYVILTNSLNWAVSISSTLWFSNFTAVLVYHGYKQCICKSVWLIIWVLGFLQSDEDCCNSCEEVREAYRKKGWGLSNPDLIDQVSQYEILLSHDSFFKFLHRCTDKIVAF